MADIEELDHGARLELQQAFVTGVIDASKASIDRARDSAKTVQTAAAAIVTIYTAVLGVSFSVTSKPLPSRGLVPAVLLGAAIVLSTVYLAYLSKSRDQAVDIPEMNGAPDVVAGEVARAYVLWTQAAAMTRRYWIRASVLALGVGLLFLPAPFITFQGTKAKVPMQAQAWPDAPAQVTDPALSRILYTAQVKEAAAARAKATTPTKGYDLFWWIAGAVGLLIALAAPAGIAHVVGDDDSDPGAGKLPQFNYFA